MTTLPARAQKLMRPDGTAPRVLVVDDEHNLTELLSMALRYEGWEVQLGRHAAWPRSVRPASSSPTRWRST